MLPLNFPDSTSSEQIKSPLNTELGSKIIFCFDKSVPLMLLSIFQNALI